MKALPLIVLGLASIAVLSGCNKTTEAAADTTPKATPKRADAQQLADNAVNNAQQGSQTTSSPTPGNASGSSVATRQTPVDADSNASNQEAAEDTNSLSRRRAAAESLGLGKK